MDEDTLRCAWEWMHEFWDANTDDNSPDTYEGFVVSMTARLDQGECFFIVRQDDVPVGIIGLKNQSKGVGTLKGVLFSKAVHGTSVTKDGFGLFLDCAKNMGYRKLQAVYYRSNGVIRNFLAKFGARVEGTLMNHVLKRGRLITCELVAIFLENN